MIKPKLLVLFLLIGLPYRSFSQFGISHEIGMITGRIEFRSDYGEQGDSKTNLSNQGFGIALVDYMNFSYYDRTNSYFKEHFKVRSELSYSKTNLKHYGKWTEGNSELAKRLNAMSGSTQLLNLGFQLEYYLIHIHDYENEIGSFNPYIALGPQFSYFSPTVTSTLGNLDAEGVLIEKYKNAVSNESKATFSATLNLGVRYKLTSMSDLILDTRAQYFASDWVDGVNPNKNIHTENKHNDWLTFVGLGYIFYFDH